MATVNGFLAQAEADKLLLATAGVTNYTATPNYLTPTTTVGTLTAAGTELAAGGGRVSWTITSGAITTVNGARQGPNAAAINFTNMPAGTLNGVENYDAITAGNRKHYGGLATPRTTAAGDSLQINAGSLTVSLL